ncbi:MAG: hypothetical protein LAN59_16150 [Acidobacteriia bacterium]|nr:hypothetical protein [Terriglobia bacterium]
MKAVTEQNKVLNLAQKIVDLCHKHTDNATFAMTAAQIAEKVIFSDWVCLQSSEAHALSVEAPEHSPLVR